MFDSAIGFISPKDISLESQWRALILFGRNSATYKFAFAKTLLELANHEKTRVTISELAEPFSKHVIEHLKDNDKQGNASSSKFLDACRGYIAGEIGKEKLLSQTERFGFVNVIDAFQMLNRDRIPNPFYETSKEAGKKAIVVTDNLLRLKDSFQFRNFNFEVEARWKLVETAWNLKINPALLEVSYDDAKEQLFIQNNLMRRIGLTSIRDALNGYQKGKCFYSFRDILIGPGTNKSAVDHFLPHAFKRWHLPVNINGVWNLVLADPNINFDKGTRVPNHKYLERLYRRNEFFIESKHPLSETIINQTGSTAELRRRFLQQQYNIALQLSVHTWQPKEELQPTF